MGFGDTQIYQSFSLKSCISPACQKILFDLEIGSHPDRKIYVKFMCYFLLLLIMTSNLTETLWVLVTYRFSKALNSCLFPGVDMDFDMHPDKKKKNYNSFIVHWKKNGF